MLLISNLISFVRVAHYARKQVSIRFRELNRSIEHIYIFHLSLAMHVSTYVFSSTVDNEIVDGFLGSSK